MTGGILADSEIHAAIACGDIEIDPYEPAHVNPVSIDLTLGDQVLIYLDWVSVHNDATYLMACDPVGPGFDVRNVPRTQSLRIGESGFLLKPGIGYLMHTRERIHTKKYVSIIDGKSSLGRLFLQVHFTAGYGDVGFNGQYTLEVSVLHPLRIYAGMKIAQMRFHTVVGEVEKLYEGNYTGNDAHGPVASKAYKQFSPPLSKAYHCCSRNCLRGSSAGDRATALADPRSFSATGCECTCQACNTVRATAGAKTEKARLDPEGTAKGKTVLTAPVIGDNDGVVFSGPASTHVDTETGKRTPLAVHELIAAAEMRGRIDGLRWASRVDTRLTTDPREVCEYEADRLECEILAARIDPTATRAKSK